MMKKKASRPNKYGLPSVKKFHYCGDGFKGHVVKAHGIIFCGFCGKEFRH